MGKLAASPPRKPARARLTFRGRPVLQNHGIFAEFGSAAVDKFADAIATIAASLEGPLGARGTLPNRESYRMLITGTALGSFGFELEEHVPAGQLSLPGLSPIEEAIDEARTMMEATLGTDDDLAEAASGTDRRAVAALRDFVKILADHEAVCAWESDGKVFRFCAHGRGPQNCGPAEPRHDPRGGGNDERRVPGGASASSLLRFSSGRIRPRSSPGRSAARSKTRARSIMCLSGM